MSNLEMKKHSQEIILAFIRENQAAGTTRATDIIEGLQGKLERASVFTNLRELRGLHKVKIEISTDAQRVYRITKSSKACQIRVNEQGKTMESEILQMLDEIETLVEEHYDKDDFVEHAKKLQGEMLGKTITLLRKNRPMFHGRIEERYIRLSRQLLLKLK